MANQMTFFLDLIRLGEELPKFTSKANGLIEENSETNLPQNLYICPVCRSRFIYLSSFIKSCGSHLSVDVNLEASASEQDLSVVVKTEDNPKERESERDSSGTEDEMTTSTSASENDLLSDEEQKARKKSNGRKRKRVSVLPEDHVFYCKLCDKTFIRRQTYRDHLLGHENPLIKCCVICSTQFSSGIIASKHKKKFHPELYQKEMRERAEERAKKGRSRTVYHTIPKSAITNNGSVGRNIKRKSRIKNFRIVLDRVCLPGFLRNDWIYLPKKKEDYPWVVDKIKDEPKPKEVVERVKYEKEESDDGAAWLSGDDNNDLSEYVVEVKTETQNDVSYEQNSTFDRSYQEKPLKPKKESSRASSFYIKPEEIAHIPEFLGAKYIFNVYDERRNKKLKASKKKKKTGGRAKRKRETSDEDTAGSDEETSTKNKDQADFLRPFPKKQWVTYKPDPKTCQICGETRTKSNIRRHIATVRQILFYYF